MTIRFRGARLATAITCCVFAFFVAGDAGAFNSYLTTFKSTYPSSTSGNAGCVTCHGTKADGSSDTGTWNRYGAALRTAGGATFAARLTAVEGRPYQLQIRAGSQEFDVGVLSQRFHVQHERRSGAHRLSQDGELRDRDRRRQAQLGAEPVIGPGKRGPRWTAVVSRISRRNAA